MINVTFEWDDEKLIDQLDQAQVKGLEDATAFLLEKANERVPYLSGDLMLSGHIEDIPFTKPGLMGKAIVYSEFYAVFLHEHPEWNFQNGREAKWLESTFDADGEAAIQKLTAPASEVFND